MALLKCPECGGQVSSAAAACPACGYPMVAATPTVAPSRKPLSGEVLLLVRQSWWNYFWHLAFAWLIVPWVVAWLERRGTLLRVYADRLSLEHGVLTKCSRELFIRDIRSIDLDQTLLGKMVGIGDLTISTAATTDAAVVIAGIPNPQHVRDLIIAHRQAR